MNGDMVTETYHTGNVHTLCVRGPGYHPSTKMFTKKFTITTRYFVYVHLDAMHGLRKGRSIIKVPKGSYDKNLYVCI